jgi:sulfur-carrier protein
MRLVYFAKVRETLGIDGEERQLPDTAATVGEALDWLAGQGEDYAKAFADRSKLRFALDQRMVRADADIRGASEFAIFPPVTGG